jgi:hypothetical protein
MWMEVAMSRSHARRRFGRSLLGVLLAAVMTLGFTGAFAPATAAQGITPLQACLALFPNGISGSQATAAALQGSGLSQEMIDAIVAAASTGDMTCYDIFGGAPPEPTVAPTEPPVVPTQPPVEPTKEPVVHPTNAPVEPTKAPAEPTKAPAEPTKATGGKTAATVTTMPTTGHGPDSSSGLPAGLLAALATVLALVAGVTARLTATRNARR